MFSQINFSSPYSNSPMFSAHNKFKSPHYKPHTKSNGNATDERPKTPLTLAREAEGKAKLKWMRNSSTANWNAYNEAGREADRIQIERSANRSWSYFA